jgi:hypothetical protein
METVGAFAEQQQQMPPDLYEAYADHEVTLFGVTASIAQLKSMCPIPQDDPRMSMEAQNNFIVKAMNMAGSEVLPEHEQVFTATIEKLGIEPKFTVKPLAPEPAPVLEITQTLPDVSAEVLALDRVIPRPLVEEEVYIRQQEQTLDDVAVNLVKTDAVVTPSVIPEHDQQAVPITPEPELAISPLTSPSKAEVTVLDSIPRAEERPRLAADRAVEVVASVVAPEAIDKLPDFLITADEKVQTPLLDTIAVENNTNDVLPDDLAKAVYMEQPPQSQVEAFTEVLIAIEKLATDETSADQSLVGFDEQPELHEVFVAAQPIVQELHTAITEATPELQAATLPIMHEMMAISEALPSLDPITVEQVRERLVVLCEELFQQLDIPYDDEKIALFVDALVLQYAQSVEQTDEQLIDEGTHEMKHFTQSIANFINDQTPLHAALGMVALLRSAYNARAAA